MFDTEPAKRQSASMNGHEAAVSAARRSVGTRPTGARLPRSLDNRLLPPAPRGEAKDEEEKVGRLQDRSQPPSLTAMATLKPDVYARQTPMDRRGCRVNIHRWIAPTLIHSNVQLFTDTLLCADSNLASCRELISWIVLSILLATDAGLEMG